MDLIPAIDLKQGRCVRLLRGRKDRETRYSDNPVQMALHWQNQGAPRLHLVDLDGAFGEAHQNHEIILRILSELEIPCQVGGGLRSTEAVHELLEAGADAAIIGTAGIRDPDWLESLVHSAGADSVYAGVDAKQGEVMVEGWAKGSSLDRLQWVQELERRGLRTVIYTDVQRDGTQEGPDYQGTREILERTSLNVIASGGVGTMDHLRRFARFENPRLQGVITGRALYEGTIDLQQALNMLEPGPGLSGSREPHRRSSGSGSAKE